MVPDVIGHSHGPYRNSKESTSRANPEKFVHILCVTKQIDIQKSMPRNIRNMDSKWNLGMTRWIAVDYQLGTEPGVHRGIGTRRRNAALSQPAEPQKVLEPTICHTAALPFLRTLNLRSEQPTRIKVHQMVVSRMLLMDYVTYCYIPCLFIYIYIYVRTCIDPWRIANGSEQDLDGWDICCSLPGSLGTVTRFSMPEIAICSMAAAKAGCSGQGIGWEQVGRGRNKMGHSNHCTFEVDL